jgi:hypothetical protein
MAGRTALRWGFWALVLCTVSAAAADPAPASPESELQKMQQRMDELKAQNLQLRDRNAELERHLLDLNTRLRQLETQLKEPAKILIPPLNYAPLNSPGILPNGRVVPEGWREERFNGLPYYVIPLQGAAADQGRSGMR